jgi:hypothetical protein
LVDGKAYSDTKKSEAIADAAADATTKKAEAIAAAAADATTKKGEAIADAALDATAKSSAAQTAAEVAASVALSAEASAQNAARNALRLETGSHGFSQDGYVSSMFLKAGSVASNESSRKFSAASLCSEITVGCSEAQAADCEFKIRVIGDDGSTKSTESLTMLANETFAQKSFSAAVVAGDRLSVESVGLCKDPHCAVEFSKDV